MRNSAATSGCVLYIGGFELPDGNAAAHRVMGIAKLMRTLGYETVFLHRRVGAREARTSYGGFECYEFPLDEGRVALLRGLWDTRSVESVIRSREDIRVVIAYNYPAVALARLKRFCTLRNVLCLADVTDWHGSRKRSLAYKLVKGLDTLLRMRVVHKRLDGLIVVSRYLERYYETSVPTVRIPPLYDLSDGTWDSHRGAGAETGHRLVYAGSPSSEKERLDLLVDAIQSIRASHDVELDVVGVTRDEFLRMYGRQGLDRGSGTHDRWTTSEHGIAFHGRVSHQEALDFVKRADFTVLVREVNRVTAAGFPTKFVESIACGTPVIASESSDLGEFLSSGENGFLVSLSNLAEDLECVLQKDTSVTVQRVLFDYHAYKKDMMGFLSTVSTDARRG